MDPRAEACGAFFLPSLPSFQFLSSAFRTDSLVLAICAPLAGLIDVETKLRRKGQRGNPKSWSVYGTRVCRWITQVSVTRSKPRLRLDL